MWFSKVLRFISLVYLGYGLIVKLKKNNGSGQYSHNSLRRLSKASSPQITKNADPSSQYVL